MLNNTYFILLIVAIGFSACVDRTFDEPPINGEDPNISAEQIVTVEDVLSHYVPGEVVALDMDKYLSAIVVADDRSGNFFRSIVVQDETGGLTVLLDDVELFNKYFEGRRLFILLKDLYVSDYAGLPQIGYTPVADGTQTDLSRIPAVLIDDIIIPGTFNNEMTPQNLTIDDLGFAELNTLVEISDVQFSPGSSGTHYADFVNLNATNHSVEDCNGYDIVLRTSGYADFASALTPEGNGTIKGIFGVFNNDRQILLRKLDDVNMAGERCSNCAGIRGVQDVQNMVSEFFEDANDFDDVDKSGWSNINCAGSRLWFYRSFSGNGFAEMESYQDNADFADAWLITPPFNLSGVTALTFRSAQAFYRHDGLTVLISTDFGGDPAGATWTNLNPDLAGSSDDNYAWVDSGQIDLTSFSGTGHVAFRYEGSTASNTTKFRIDNVIIE